MMYNIGGANKLLTGPLIAADELKLYDLGKITLKSNPEQRPVIMVLAGFLPGGAVWKFG